MNAFGELLKDIREENGITQIQIEEITGIKRNTISMIENGQRKPTKQQLKSLISFLGMEESDLREIIETEIIDELGTLSIYGLIKILDKINKF